ARPRAAAQVVERRLAVARLADLVALVAQRLGDRGPHRVVVLDDEDGRVALNVRHDQLSCMAHARSRGRVTVKVVPSPGRLSTAICPPRALTGMRVTHRPRPKPPKRCGATARSNRSKIRRWSSGAMPMPLSRTAMTSAPSCAAAVTSTGLPRPYFKALDRRL